MTTPEREQSPGLVPRLAHDVLERLRECLPHMGDGPDHMTYCTVLGADLRDAVDALAAPPAANAPTEALHAIMRFADKAKEPCGMDPESPAAIRNGAFATIAAMAAQGLGLVRGPSLSAPPAATAVRLTEEQRNAAIHAAREGMHVPHTPGEWNRWLARTIERAVLAANGLGEQPGSGT